jgi:hypothetical protein
VVRLPLPAQLVTVKRPSETMMDLEQTIRRTGVSQEETGSR